MYQPQVDAWSKEVIGVEALLCWNNEKLGLVPPDVFIPIAEATGGIIEIGDFVLETSMFEVSELLKRGIISKDIRLSINVSVRQLWNEGFAEQLSKLSKTYPQLSLVIEVTESLFIEDLNAAKLI